MATPIVEQIALAIKAKLLTVTTANGYNVTVSEVLRPTRTGVEASPQSYGIVLLQEDPTQDDELSYDSNVSVIGWNQPFSVTLAIWVSEKSETPIDSLLNTFVADVTKALMDDPQWNDLACYSNVTDYSNGKAEDGSWEGVQITYEVKYRVAEDDPYTAR